MQKDYYLQSSSVPRSYDGYYYATRSPALVTFATVWNPPDDELLRPEHWVFYGLKSWPSYSEWVVPQSASAGQAPR